MHTLAPLAIMYALIINCVKMEDQCSYVAQETAVEVPDCPRNAAQYAERKRLKQCEKLTTRCGNATYHCVVNPYMNATIETCAPRALIIGSVCAEINRGERPIQSSSHENAKCEKCPNHYWSTEAYKYPKCYDAVQREETDQNSTEETGFDGNTTDKTGFDRNTTEETGFDDDGSAVGSYIGIAVTVLIKVIIAVFIYLWWKKRNFKAKMKPKTSDADGAEKVEFLRSFTDESESIQNGCAPPKECQLEYSVQTKQEMNSENNNDRNAV